MEGTLLSDELLEALMAVGQVDVLVGVPTLDHAATVAGVVRAVHQSFATHFLRARTALINLDAGSKDGTPEIVRGASLRDSETLITAQSLRTIHRISTPYHGLPGKGGAVRTLLAAGELLGARAIALFDPDVVSITPDWVEGLVRPVFDGRADFVAPLVPRHPLEGPLVTQLVRPFVSAAYGHRLREPLASEFACSARFAAHCLAQPVWETPLVRYGSDLWLTTTALAKSFACVQVPLGPRIFVPNAPRPSLPETFKQVVGALFACLEEHQDYWLARAAPETVPICGASSAPPAEAGTVDPRPLAESFRSAMRDLGPVLESILEPSTLARLRDAATGGDRLAYPDELWVASVYQGARAFHHDVIHREHVIQALVPLYLGRAAAFLAENQGAGATAVEACLERLGRCYEDAKPDLVRLWAENPRR
jgi:hypothetical protein